MENTCCLSSMLILLFIRSTEGLSVGATISKTNDNLGEEGILLNPRNISALIGNKVTLGVDTSEKSEIQDIQWVKNGVNFATTTPNRVITIRDNRYDGRLSSSDDGSLVIHNIIMEDQGEYKADILMSNLKKNEIVYLLLISEEMASGRTHLAVVVVSVIVVLALVAAGAVITFRMWKQKPNKNTKRNQPRSDPEGTSELENIDKRANLTQDSSRDDETEEFHDAVEHQEEMEGGHTS